MALVLVVVAVIAGHVVVEVPGQLLGFVGHFLRLVGGFFGLVGLLLGAFGAAASLLGGGASFVGTQDGPGNRLVVAPFVGQLGRFLGQVGGFLRLICGLRGVFGPLPGLFGQVAGVLGDLPGLVGLVLGYGLGAVRLLGLGVFRGGSVGVFGVRPGPGLPRRCRRRPRLSAAGSCSFQSSRGARGRRARPAPRAGPRCRARRSRPCAGG